MSNYKFLPLFDTLSTYDSKTFRSDLFAGLTIGTILIPQGMAYALLAGMPPIYGLYASLIPIVIYALFATSSKLSIGPVAVSALLVLAGISQIAEPGSSEYITFVITAGLLIGLLQLLLGLFKMGFLVNFLSHPVIAGFTSAAAIIIVISQLKDALGLDIENSSSALMTLRAAFADFANINWITAGLCLTSLLVILTLKKINKKIPGPLIVVVIGIVVSYYFNLEAKGVEIIKSIPQGLPSFQLPNFSLDLLQKLYPTVLTVTLIGIVESIGIAKALEAKHKDHIVKADKELIALGLSKIAGSFFQAIPTSGSFSRSAINSNSGGKTQMSGLITVLMIVIALLFLTSLFYYLPKSILAAIILLAVISLFDYKEAKHLWHSNRNDFLMMAATFFATLFLGIEPGVICGVILSILLVLYKSSKPTMAELGNITGTRYYKNLERFEQAEGLPNTLILRFESQMFFGNSVYFKESIYDRIEAHHESVQYIILDGSQVSDIDSTAMHMLKDLDLDLKSKEIELHLCGAIGSVRDSLHKSGLLAELDKHHINVHAAVEFIHNSDSEMICRPIDPLQNNVQ